MKYGYIYKTTNLINGRVYIGQKKGIFNPQYLGSGLLVNKAINKRGRSNFKLEVIVYAKDKEKLNELEKFYIAKYRKIFGKDILYNLTNGGTGGALLGKSLKSMSIKQKNNWKTLSYRNKQKLAGNPFLNPHIEISSKGGKNSWKNATIKRHKYAAINFKKINKNKNFIAKRLLRLRSPLFRKIVSIAMTKNWNNINHRKKVKNAVMKYWITPKNHRKASIRTIKSWITRRKNAVGRN